MVLNQIAPMATAPLRLVEWPVPQPGPGEVLLKVSCCAICRTDLHVIEGELPRPRLPLIPGHQVVGTVAALGAGCRRLAVGRRAGIAWLRHTCGVCPFCTAGRENLCEAARCPPSRVLARRSASLRHHSMSCGLSLALPSHELQRSPKIAVASGDSGGRNRIARPAAA
jgi:Zn-dependent alcohol dehydrogenase